MAPGKEIILDARARWGATHFPKSTPKRLSQLRTGQQEVPGTASRIDALCDPGPILVTTGFSGLGDAFLLTRVKILHIQSQAYDIRLIMYTCL